MKIRNLQIIFVVLVVLVVATRLFKERGDDRTFRDELVSIDTAAVTAITLWPKTEGEPAIHFTRVGNNWTLDNGGRSFTADRQALNIMMRTLNDLNTDQVAARSSDRWENFHVTESTATRVLVEEAGKPAADVLIGRFFVQQNIQDARSYIRLNGDDDVYMVPGLLSLSFDRAFNSWRNRKVVAVDPGAVKRIVFSYPADSGFALSMPDSTWLLDGDAADSSAVVQYLGRMRNLVNQDFVDDGSTVSAPVYTITLEGPSIETIRIQAESALGREGFLISSSENPEATWMSDSTGLFDTLFQSRSAFVRNR